VRATVVLAAAATLAALAPNFWCLAVCSLVLGFASCVPHLLLPIATLLAPKEQGGRVIGAVMSGLLIGVLSARTISGVLGGSLGWRTVYWLVAILTIAMAWLIHRELPECHTTEGKIGYLSLLASSLGMFKYRQMREWAFISGMFFGAFNAFWTTLVFVLETPPYHYGARMAGGLGILAIASAAAAPLMGRVVDRYSARFGVGCAIAILLLSFVLLYGTGLHLWGMVIGIVLLDASAQSGHVANLTRLYATFPNLRSRAGMAYMMCFFGGGSLGSFLGGWSWVRFGWAGVCGTGLAMVLAALLMHLRSCAQEDKQRSGVAEAIAEG
jgi:predicted MFS family arabinose efflux permease